MFLDKARIYVKAGDGGDGVTRWRREKYIPAGGPAGGDGGTGGSIFFEVDEGLSTLASFKYTRQFKAPNGEHGQSNNMAGKDGEDIVIKVPPGTVVKDGDTQEILMDLIEAGQRVLLAKGGRGGRGNTHFKTATRQAPGFAERGEPGLDYWLDLELKLIADAGLVGYPNAGKSTLLSVVSAARPKIANYPFTTLIPNLGVVTLNAESSFVLADIPGLIEGAHAGVGLGTEFLRHVERTRVILHVVDLAGVDGRDPIEDYHQINKELGLYSERLAKCPMLVVGNKTDLPEAQENEARLAQIVASEGKEFFPISAVAQRGVTELMRRTNQLIQKLRAEDADSSTKSSGVVLRPDPVKAPVSAFTIRRENEDYVVEGEGLLRYMRRLDLNNEEAIRHLQRLFEKIGLYQALREVEVPEGATVRVGDLEFEFQE